MSRWVYHKSVAEAMDDMATAAAAGDRQGFDAANAQVTALLDQWQAHNQQRNRIALRFTNGALVLNAGLLGWHMVGQRWLSVLFTLCCLAALTYSRSRLKPWL